MSRMIVTLAIEDAAMNPLGAKEAAAMALEKLGGVQVLQVDVQEPEQMGLEGMAPAAPARSAPRSSGRNPQAQPMGGQAQGPRPSSSPRRGASPPMVCCYTCAQYRSERGKGEHGQLYWGICRRTGRPVYDLKNQCGAWGRQGRP